MAPRLGWKKNTQPCSFDPSTLSLAGEEWREVVGWERFYRVSNLGRVCSLHLKTPSFVTGMKVRGGYRVLKVRDGSRQANVMVHHIVLEAFVAPRRPGMEGCHGALGVGNNSLANLRWDTKSGNQADRILHGTDNYRGSSALTPEVVRKIRTTLETSDSEWARLCGCSEVAVLQARLGRTWRDLDVPPMRRRG